MVVFGSNNLKKPQRNVSKSINKKDGEKKDHSVPIDTEIDQDARYEGTVTSYINDRGFGFIKPSETSLPFDEIMVHWQAIQSEDRWPSLKKDMVVEFSVNKMDRKNKSGSFLKANNVCLPGGEHVNLQDEMENKLDYVHDNKNFRYTGKVVWYDFKKGFGFVKLDDGFELPAEVPSELKVHRSEIVSTEAPRLKDGMEVEFGISINKKGTHAIHHLTLPNGAEVTRQAIDQREMVGEQIFKGTVKSFGFGTGWIELDEQSKSELPSDTAAALKAFTQKRQERASKFGEGNRDEWLHFRKADSQQKADLFINVGDTCTFKMYVDSMGGVGATEMDFTNE